MRNHGPLLRDVNFVKHYMPKRIIIYEINNL